MERDLPASDGCNGHDQGWARRKVEARTLPRSTHWGIRGSNTWVILHYFSQALRRGLKWSTGTWTSTHVGHQHSRQWFYLLSLNSCPRNFVFLMYCQSTDQKSDIRCLSDYSAIFPPGLPTLDIVCVFELCPTDRGMECRMVCPLHSNHAPSACNRMHLLCIRGPGLTHNTLFESV